MPTILVSGLINVETTLRVDGFPIDYTPVRYPFLGIRSTVSGVAYNVAKALATLGHEVRLLSLIGRDAARTLVRSALAEDGLAGEFVLEHLRQTPQSAILYDGAGRRMINTDLKDIQEQVYPPRHFARALAGCDLAVLCNVNFSRPYLRTTKEEGIPIATDVHAIADLEDAYNADFMAAADILFMSHECLPCSPPTWVRRLYERYRPAIIGVGLGEEGALLSVSGGPPQHIPAVSARPVVSTIGAGDALFSAFLHGYTSTHDPLAAMRQAVVFASYKIGESGAAEGFLDAHALVGWCERLSETPAARPA